ncbi:MAG: TIGR02221 family CRISPR-associated protein [Desulfobacteraceae bacterium]
MRRLYMSFLGLGSYKEDKGIYEYDPTVYQLHGRSSTRTKFVQVAEIELLGPGRFDTILVVTTDKSYGTHFEALRQQLEALGSTEVISVRIPESMEPQDQWIWFERILAHIEPGDELTVDITHGYRSIPIVFSAAINFLQKARGVILNAVYYGAYDKDRSLAPIVNMKDFFAINEWAEGVSRLVEDADIRKIAEVSETTPDFQVGELNDDELIKALNDLTNAIRNVDVNNVGEKAGTAIELVKRKRTSASLTGRMLLGLVLDKFAGLVSSVPATQQYYKKAYFLVQLELIRMLLEHKLYMQAYTVMRELIAAIGVLEVAKDLKVLSSKGRDKRKYYGEIFVRMMKYPRESWDFSGKEETAVGKLLPFYESLDQIGAGDLLKKVVPDLLEFRNGFDHCWTSKPGADAGIQQMGDLFLERLTRALDILVETGIISE